MIKKACSHLIFESEMKVSYTLFGELTGKGTAGLLVTTTYPPKLKKAYDLEAVDFIWLSELPEDGAKNPRELKGQVIPAIDSFISRNPGCALLVDNMENIYTDNSEEDFRDFAVYLSSLPRRAAVTVIVPMDPVVLSKEMLDIFSGLFDRVMDVRSVSIEPNGKECPRCGAMWNSNVTVCSICGYEFERPHKEISGEVEEIQPTPQMHARLGDHGEGSWFKKGVDYEKAGYSGKAIEAYRKALEDFPEDPWIWINLGVSYQRVGKSEDAVKCYDNALKLNPLDADAWSNKAIALRILGRIEDALECYDRALDIDPGDAGIWSNKGVALRALGRVREALECYDRALDIDPRDVGTWLNKAVLLQRTGRIGDAVECYRKILEIDPYHPVAMRNMRLLSRLNPEFE